MKATEPNDQVLEKMLELYVGYRGRYILCLPDGHIITPKKRDGTYGWLSDNVMRNHLDQKYAVGIFADKYGSKFLCFDVDNGSAETVRAIIDELHELGFPEDTIYVSYSGNKGYHVEMFFDECIATWRLKKLYHHVIVARGLDPNKVEFRPESTASIKLPLSRHAKTGNICWFVDPQTLCPIQQVEYVLAIRQQRTQDIEHLIPAESQPTPEKTPEQVASGKGRSSPETRNLGTTLEQEGTRHNMMRNIVVYQRRHGASREECERVLEDWLQAQDASLYRSSVTELQRDMDELIAWAYSDRFSLQKVQSVDSTVLHTSMLQSVLAQSNRIARRLCFLLLVRGRMNQSRISEKDAGKAIGASVQSVSKAIRRLSESGDIQITEGKRFTLSDGIFSSESRRYVVPHAAGYRNELSITITMRELISDFNVCYHKALHA